MSPRRVVKKAIEKRLDMIAICDHNSAENVAAAQQCATGTALAVLGGIEVMSAEEVHVTALFDRARDLLRLQRLVYERLPDALNRADVFGEQIIANQGDEVVGYNKRMLIGATTVTLEDLVDRIHQFGGLAIASHVDRESFGIIGTLGFIPPGLRLDAVEISSHIGRAEALRRFPELAAFPVVSSSDAHYLDDIGKRTTGYLLESPTVQELMLALTNREGRQVALDEKV